MDALHAAHTQHTMEDIERITAALESAPVPARPMSKQEALDKLATSLKAARDRGHTMQGLVDQLGAQGLRTHVRAVSAAIGRLGTAKPASKKLAKRTPSTTSPSIAGTQA